MQTKASRRGLLSSRFTRQLLAVITALAGSVPGLAVWTTPPPSNALINTQYTLMFEHTPAGSSTATLWALPPNGGWTQLSGGAGVNGQTLNGGGSWTPNVTGVWTIKAVEGVGSWGNVIAGPTDVSVGVPAAPDITGHPQSATVTVGGNHTFSVTTSGTPPFTYQWLKDNTNIPGATSSQYTLTNIQTADAGQYKVLVSNAVNGIYSNAATLTVTPAGSAPTIVSHPVSQSVVAGQVVTFSVSASGTAPLSYQWFKDGASVGGATNASLALSNVQPANAGVYTVVVSNGVGSATSNGATLAVGTVANFTWGTINPGADPGIPSASPGVGALAASVSVDNKGFANGSMPLKIPPGRSGLQPSLSLNYSSNGGNGPLGLGWSLSTGFPQAITRGRSILARDGEVRGVSFTATDKFYLDGKRLICVSGTYGTPGSIYRTEVDSFVTVTTTGTGSNIETFVVTDKAGTKLTFGKHAGTTDGYQMGGGAGETLAYTYALKQVEDTLSNTVTFNYLEVVNTAGERLGEYVLGEILYSSDAIVTFHYNFKTVAGSIERLDRTTSYIAGKVFAQSRRLDGINVKMGADRVAYYTLDYEYAPNAGPLRLTQISPYLRDGTGSGFTSFPATQLTWSASTQNYFTHDNNDFMPSGAVPGSYAFADVNGDGLDDLVDARTGPIQVSLANGTGGFSEATSWTDPGIWSGAAILMQLADINGDGRKDIIFGRAFKAGDKLYALVSNGSKFVPLSGSGSATEIFTFSNEFADSTPNTDYLILTEDQNGVTSRFATADFTGDGCDDILIHRYDGLLKLIRWNGSGFDTSLSPYNVGAEALTNEDPWMLVPNGNGTPAPFSFVWLGLRYRMKFSLQMMPCELNGDGITDYAWVRTDHKWTTWDAGAFGTGTTAYVGKFAYAVTSQPGGGFSARTSIFSTGAVAGSPATNIYRSGLGHIYSGDVNGDGLTDFVTIQPADVEDYPGGQRRVMQHSLLLSRGGTGQPSFQYYLNAGITPNVTINGTTVNPYFDALSHATWTSNNFGSIGSMTPDQIGMFFSFGMSSSGDNMYLNDINQDGRADYLWYCDQSPAVGWWVMYSQGTGFAAPVSVPSSQIPWAPTEKYSGGQNYRNLSTRQALQLNGDGVPDYAAANGMSTSTPGVDSFHISAGKPGIRLTKLTDGLGRVTDIDYKPITDSSIYTPGVAVSYPIREVRSAQYVVSDVWHDSGTGNSGDRAQFSYQYSGNRLDLSGRGSLGFHSFVTLDRQTGLFKYQFLAQSFPITGLTHREETYRWWLEGGQDKFRYISSHDNVVVFDKVATAGGATLWPFISQAVEYRWEDSATAHFAFTAATANSQPENLFTQTKPTGSHIEITATSTFDTQSVPKLTLPEVSAAGFNPSDLSGSTNTVVGTTSFATFNGLPGNITDGNLRQLSTNFGGGFTETVVTDYETGVAIPGTATYYTLTGRPKTVTTTVASPGYGTETAPIKRYTYWGNTPLPATETIDAADDALDLKTTYTRDTRGRVTNTQIENTTATGLQAIGNYSVSSVPSPSTDFDDRWDLPTKTRNAEPYYHTTTTSYHAFLGLPTSVTDVNSAQVTTAYDALGRATTVTDVLKGLTTTSAYVFDDTQTVSPPAGVGGLTLASKYRVTVTATAKPSVTTWYDRLGRAIRTIKDGFGTQQTVTDTVYNVLGQVVATSLPYLQTASPQILWTKTTYDALGRVATVTAPNGTVTTNTYLGRATQVSVDAANLGGVDPAAQVNTTLVDAKGRTVKVWNADNVPALTDNVGTTNTAASIEFRLDGFGRMRETWLEGSNGTDAKKKITAAYDALGRQTQLVDPDKGPWTYLNNALGQVVSQSDAAGNTTTSSFDRLGRPLSRGTTGNGATETATFHYYDVAATASANPALNLVAQGTQGWIGAPEREQVVTIGAGGYQPPLNPVTNLPDPVTNLHYYDTKGRPALELAQTDGKWFYTATSYDAYSRPQTVRHYWKPAGAEFPNQQPYVWQDFGYVYNYDAESYLLSITDSLGRLWWDSPVYDHLDRVTSVRKGNGLTTTRAYRPEDGVLTGITTGSIQSLSFTFDGLGNLRQRTDANATGGTENLTYDILNRLETSKQGTTSYAPNGNITTKPDVAGTVSAAYGYTHANKPHAVTSAFGYTIDYDGNGNVISRLKANDNTYVKWSGFDKPRWLTRTTTSGTTGSEFHYNANRSRVLQLEFDSTSGSGSSQVPRHYNRKRTYALGSTLELNYDNLAADSAQDWSLRKVRVYVPGPDGLIGAREFDVISGTTGTEKAIVYHYDHLGSITATTDYGSANFASDTLGKPGKFSEDAWGQRRDPATWSGAPDPAVTDNGGANSVTPRGFTGHEMLDDLGLVHMNGRIYDPLLGRFLTADIVVQSPASLQAFNRYSYVYNNPLSLTDPTGFFSGGNLGSMSPQPLVTGLKASNYTNDQVEANLVLQQAIQAQAGSVTVGGALVGASMVPVVGEIMDIIGWVTDPSSRQLYAASAMANAPTGGAYTPNASALRASERLQHAGATRLDDAGRMLQRANQVERRLETAAVDAKRLSGIQFMTAAVEVTGKNATARGHSYEQKIAEMYKPHGFSKTDYKAASGASRQADSAGEAAGKAVAVEAKYVDNWEKSPANPESAAAGMDFIKGGKMDDLLSQAKDLSETFDKVIYHSNSQEFIDLYKKVFADAGYNNITFVLTSAAKK